MGTISLKTVGYIIDTDTVNERMVNHSQVSIHLQVYLNHNFFQYQHKLKYLFEDHSSDSIYFGVRHDFCIKTHFGEISSIFYALFLKSR